MESKIIIIGPGGSGKDHMRKIMEKKGFSYGISFTSRPKRKGEKEGKDYFFRDENFFQVNQDIFLEIQKFNGWFYGISRGEFQEKDLFILSPAGLRSLPKNFRKKSFVIYINPPLEIRKKRLLGRNDADGVERRLKADQKDFHDFTDYDIIITNEDF
jgi:guanylate kinase